MNIKTASQLIRLSIGLTVASSVMFFGIARAAYPDKPIKLVLGYSAGSAPDVVARNYAENLSRSLGQPVIVENRSGAGGQIAAQAVVKAPADGYTVFLSEPGAVAIAPAAYSKLTYKSQELRMVAKVVDVPMVFVTGANGSKNLNEFLAAAKASQTSVSLGTYGPGTPTHLMVELLATAGGFKAEPIHYRQSGDAVSGVLVGDVKGIFMAPSSAAPFIKAGKMTALGITSPGRMEMLSDVPTFVEQKIPSLDLPLWLGFFIPAGTPQPIAEQLGAAILNATKDATVRSQLISTGYMINPTTGKAAQTFFESEAKRWAEIVRMSGFRGD